MTLSTSHSDSGRRFPRRLGFAIGIAIAAWVFSAIYTLHWNPEIALFKHAARVKSAWAEKLDQQFTNKAVVFGGSSSTFSVDGGHALQKHQFPIANLALGAGMGAKVLTRFALPHVQRGDTMVMMIEPGLFFSDLNATQLGIQFSIALGHANYAHESDDLLPQSSLPWRAYLAALRPGGYHFFTLLGKLLRGQAVYRYAPADFDESGHQETAARSELVTPRGKINLSSDSKMWLQKLSGWCEKEGVELVYALPWAYCPPEQRSDFQRENAHFLLQVQEFMPVLRDPSLGAYETAEHFADTSYHLNRDGAALRTDALVDALRKRHFWTAQELKSFQP